MANLNFNSEGVERPGNFDPMPNGDYPAMISESQMKHPKDPYGTPDASKPMYLELKLTIIDGEFKGRTVFDRLHLNNANETTRKIAKGTLASILDAVGMVSINDSSEMHNKPLIIKVVVKPESGQYSAGNEVKGYSQYKAETSAIQPKQVSATPAGAKKPWEA
jgi:hypothetical protein